MRFQLKTYAHKKHVGNQYSLLTSDRKVSTPHTHACWYRDSQLDKTLSVSSLI